MPNCFQLFRKGESSPLVLNRVDEEICTFLQVPVDDRKYCYDWFNVIGFLIAMGKPLGSEELRIAVRDWTDVVEYQEKLLEILDFMESRYTSDAFVQIGRRDR
jgi:hypothetical protein